MNLAEEAPSQLYFPAFDGLRGIAVLLVVLNHFVIPLPTTLEFFRARGHLGVEIFFAISGFLVMRSFHSSIFKHWKQSRGAVLWDFFVRRASRIFVPYYLVLVGVLLLSRFVGSLGQKVDAMSGVLPSFFFYFFNYAKSCVDGDVPGALNVMWSLAFEEQFYVLLAVLGFFFLRRLSLALVILCLLSVLWRFVATFIDPEMGFNVLQLSTHLRLDAILIGGLVYLYHQKLVGWFQAQMLLRWAVALGVVFAFYAGDISGSSTFSFAVDFLWSSLFFSLGLVGILAFPQSLCARVLSRVELVFIGQISYEIYLVHQLVNAFLVKIQVSNSPVLYGFLMVLCSVIVAKVFHRAIGRPSQSWMKLRLLRGPH